MNGLRRIAPLGFNTKYMSQTMKTKIGIPAFALATLLFLGMPLASSSGYVAVSVGTIRLP